MSGASNVCWCQNQTTSMIQMLSKWWLKTVTISVISQADRLISFLHCLVMSFRTGVQLSFKKMRMKMVTTSSSLALSISNERTKGSNVCSPTLKY